MSKARSTFQTKASAPQTQKLINLFYPKNKNANLPLQVTLSTCFSCAP